MIEPIPEPRAKRLRPRDWAALERGLRAPSRRDRLGQAREEERRRRRLEGWVVVACADCGRELAEVRPGTSVLCRSCRIWTLGPVGDAEVPV